MLHKKVMLLLCSGCTPEGRIAGRAAAELAEEGIGEMYSLVENGIETLEFEQAVKEGSRFVMIDGCDNVCGKTMLEKADMPVKNHVVASRLSIQNKNEDEPAPEDVAVVKHSVKLASGEPIRFTFNSPKPLSPGDRVKSKMFGGKCC